MPSSRTKHDEHDSWAILKIAPCSGRDMRRLGDQSQGPRSEGFMIEQGCARSRYHVLSADVRGSRDCHHGYICEHVRGYIRVRSLSSGDLHCCSSLCENDHGRNQSAGDHRVCAVQAACVPNIGYSSHPLVVMSWVDGGRRLPQSSRLPPVLEPPSATAVSPCSACDWLQNPTFRIAPTEHPDAHPLRVRSDNKDGGKLRG